MLHHDLAKFAVSEREALAAQERLARELRRLRRRRPLRVRVGRSLVRIGLRMAAAQV